MKDADGDHDIPSLDPFDLPDWLGESRVVWTSHEGVLGRPLLTGELQAEARDHAAVPCDLLAVDAAFPEPVADEVLRRRAHQAWHHGEVALADRAGRPTLLVPGSSFDAAHVLVVLSRLARAVGAPPEHYAVLLRVSADRRR